MLLPSSSLTPNQILAVKLSDYPPGALKRAEHGLSWVHAEVSDNGELEDVSITQSSGSSDLDSAALNAIRSARFSPAFSDHKPIHSTALVVVSWVLPGAIPATTSVEKK